MQKFVCRVPIYITIFNLEGETIYKSSSTKKTKVRQSLTEFLRQNANTQWTGECKITYNKKLDIWNAFTFNSYATLDRNITICTEKAFLLELAKDGSLDKSYLEKRKLTDKQKEALKKNRQKSSLFNTKSR